MFLKSRFTASLKCFTLLGAVLFLCQACQPPAAPPKLIQKITESEVIAIQKAWGIGLIGIGVAYESGDDYGAAATNFIEKFYGYDIGKVLFKPTLATEKQFRTTLEGALSYFVSGNESYPEDKGFALKRWKDVHWENAGIINSNSDLAIAMGNYYFTDEEGERTKVEYTFCYRKDENGALKIVAHKSALPYNAED